MNEVQIILSSSLYYKFHEKETTSIEDSRIAQVVISKYGAHSSTQHINERLVKTASRMTCTGKSDRTANYFLIASSNGFITEYNDGVNITENETEVTEVFIFAKDHMVITMGLTS